MNECLANNGHGPCQDTCRNLEGSYECSCADIPGYRLAADNHTCEDIDECTLNNANCSHLCLNTPGSVFCLCPDGLYLTDDWKTCLGRQDLMLMSIMVSLYGSVKGLLVVSFILPSFLEQIFILFNAADEKNLLKSFASIKILFCDEIESVVI